MKELYNAEDELVAQFESWSAKIQKYSQEHLQAITGQWIKQRAEFNKLKTSLDEIRNIGPEINTAIAKAVVSCEEKIQDLKSRLQMKSILEEADEWFRLHSSYNAKNSDLFGEMSAMTTVKTLQRVVFIQTKLSRMMIDMDFQRSGRSIYENQLRNEFCLFDGLTRINDHYTEKHLPSS